MLAKSTAMTGATVAGLGMLVVLTWAVLAYPALLIAVAGVVAMPLVISSAAIRLGIVLAGALLVFQSGASTLKLGYLVVAMLCVALSLIGLARSEDQVVRSFKPMLLWSVPTLAMLLSSFLIASGLGTAFDPWMRDVLPYLLLVVLPVIGLDAGRSVSRRALENTLLIITIVAAIGFAANWLSRRGASEDTEQFLLSSATLALLGFSYALVKTGARGESRRALWGVSAAFIAACLVSSGTRTNVVILAAATVGVMGRARSGHIPPVRLAGIVAAMTAGAAAVIAIGASALRVDSGFFQGRYDALLQSLSGGLRTDQSFIIRAASYAEAEARWALHPWLGGGPGYIFRTLDSFTLDTPWVIPAKFGIVGTAVIVGFFVALVLSVRRCHGAPETAFAAARSWGVALLVLVPFGPWVEDKGTALAVTLLVALIAQQAKARTEAEHLIGNHGVSVSSPPARRAESLAGVTPCD